MTQPVSYKISVRLGCIFYVVEILSAFMMLIKIASLQKVPNFAFTFSQDSEINQSYFSTPVPESKCTFGV
jgi:hypothetical protein